MFTNPTNVPYLDYTSPFEWLPGRMLLDADIALIEEQRKNALHVIAADAVSENTGLTLRDLSQISLCWPNVGSVEYYVMLSHSMTGSEIGAISGKKLEMESGHAISEYGCAILFLRSPLAIEFLRFGTCADSIFIVVNGMLAAVMCDNCPDSFGSGQARNVETREIRIEGQLYGVIEIIDGLAELNVVIVRNDGVRMPVPLRFWESAVEILHSLWRLLILKPLWSRSVPENKNRVIDPAIAELLNDREIALYFSICLYFVTSVYGDRVLESSS